MEKMSKKQLKHFAKTKEKDLPKKVKKSKDEAENNFLDYIDNRKNKKRKSKR